MAGQAAVGGSLGTYLAAAREVLAKHPVRGPAIIAKALLGRAICGMGPDQFFLFDLHNRPLASWRDHLRLYPGFSRALKLINLSHGSVETERDKLCVTVRLLEARVPVAPILLVLGRDTAHHPASAVEAPETIELAAARLDAPETPDALFVKPSADFGGKGVTLAERTAGGWRVDGDTLSTRTLVERLWPGGGAYGMLVQPQLRNHPEMADIGGGFGLNSVRIIVALTTRGPRVLACAAKLLRRPGLADNFSEGRSGNLLADVDPATGVIGAVYGREPGEHFLLSRYVRHPATGARLAGVRLPLWRECLEAAASASRAMPETPLLGLDVAITPDRALILERNLHWDLALPQLASGEGMRATMRRVLPELAISDEVRLEVSRLLSVGPAAPRPVLVTAAPSPELASVGGG
jgi:hypothetical protein